jgi:hypothetical protein
MNALCCSVDGHSAQSENRLVLYGQKTFLYQPGTRVIGIVSEPAFCAAKAKTVSPAVHILHKSRAANTGHGIRKYDLQIANCRLLKVVAASITKQRIAPLCAHTNNVADLMQ